MSPVLAHTCITGDADCQACWAAWMTANPVDAVCLLIAAKEALTGVLGTAVREHDIDFARGTLRLLGASRQVDLEALRGVRGGICLRSTCVGSPATWYNHSTRRFYCDTCARDLNEANRAEAHQLYGHDLLTQPTVA